MKETVFADLDELAKNLRAELENKKCLLLFAYNGTGKTRLSLAFKDKGKQGDARDTLYFNAFTEDLFTWDNDLEGDSTRVLRMNRDSSFLAGLEELEMENRIRPLLQRYTDFDFTIDYENWTISFSRGVPGQPDQGFEGRREHIHMVLLPCRCRIGNGRCRGLQMGEIHLHR